MDSTQNIQSNNQTDDEILAEIKRLSSIISIRRRVITLKQKPKEPPKKRGPKPKKLKQEETEEKKPEETEEKKPEEVKKNLVRNGDINPTENMIKTLLTLSIIKYIGENTFKSHTHV